MTHQSTILLDKKVIELLKRAREYPRQTYNELLEKIVSLFITLKERDQYDKFLHSIQQSKMKELWGTKDDEVWDNA